MTITGENFPTSGFTCKAEYAGAVTTDCTINSAGEVAITWPNGAPTYGGDGIEPKLHFVANDGTITNTASGGEKVINALNINAVNGGSNLEASFNGGSVLSFDAPGLAEKVAIG
jgi:hypothetical protein